MGSEFDADTAVEYVGPGEYAATLTERWHTLAGPNGGYLLAVCLQALAAESPLPDPLAVSAYYLRPGRTGRTALCTEAVRAGRRTATGQVTLVQDGREIVRVLATFGDLGAARGRTLELGRAPQLPAPEDCLDPAGAGVLGGAPIAERVELRFADLPGWARGTPGEDPRAQFWMRLRDGRDADVLSLPLMVDAAPPPVLDLGEGGSTTLELTVHVRARPAPGWLACRVHTRHLRDGLHEEDFEIWDSAGMLVAQSRQLALLL